AVGHDRGPRFAVGGGDTEAAQERGEGNLPRERAVLRARARDALRAVDVVEPDRLRQLRAEHGRLLCPLEGAEPGGGDGDRVVARRLELLDVHDERVARFRTFHVERPRLGVVAPRSQHRARLLAGLVQGAVETILGPRDDPRAGLDPMRGQDTTERVLQLLVLRDVAQDRLLRGVGWRDCEKEGRDPEDMAHGRPPGALFHDRRPDQDGEAIESGSATSRAVAAACGAGGAVCDDVGTRRSRSAASPAKSAMRRPARASITACCAASMRRMPSHVRAGTRLRKATYKATTNAKSSALPAQSPRVASGWRRTSPTLDQ